MDIFKRHILIFFVVACSLSGLAQQQNLPLNREFNLVNQKVFNGVNSNVHTSFQPINQSLIPLDTISVLKEYEKKYYLNNISKSKKKPSKFFGWMYRSMFYENFLVVDTGNFYLTVDPLLNIEIGKDSEDSSNESLYKNTRGVIIRANVGEKFSFETSLYENQAVLPSYLTDYANAKEVIPGQGRWKKFKSNGYDFSSASANVSYSPAKFINLQLGTGKNFVGDGYRSILLSDFSFNYPYWKIITTFGKKDQFQYTFLNATLSSVTRRESTSTAEALFVRKSMSTHYFSWLATNWLNIGLFESTLWQTEDSSGTKPYQFQQLNPVFGINALTTITDEANHSNVGINLKIKIPIDLVLYGQFMLDGNQYEKTSGYQFGMRFSKVPGLTVQAEYNAISNPYESTFEPELEQFTNYNESLTHPLGNDFDEIIGILNYKYKRAFIEIKVIMANENSVIERELTILQSHIGFLINPKNNMSITLGVKKRTEDIPSISYSGETNYIYFGFRTSIRNLYDDF